MPPYRRNVNTVFQQYALFPHMTVWDNVAFGPRSRKVPEPETRKRVGELLEIVRLSEFAKRKPAQLSGGQQQRVALARALVNFPSALLLDEPLGALDLKLRQAMQIELKRIQREVGITFIFVTHDQEEALTMSDRIAVMNLGLVDQIGAPEEIYHHPGTVFVAGFIGQANLWPVTVESTTTDSVVVALGGLKFGAPLEGVSVRAGEPAQLMVRPEQRAREPDRADRRHPDAAVHGHRLRVPGSRRPLRARRTRRQRDRRPRRRRGAAPDAAPGRPDLGGLGHERGAAPARPPSRRGRRSELRPRSRRIGRVRVTGLPEEHR